MTKPHYYDDGVDEDDSDHENDICAVGAALDASVPGSLFSIYIYVFKDIERYLNMFDLLYIFISRICWGHSRAPEGRLLKWVHWGFQWSVSLGGAGSPGLTDLSQKKKYRYIYIYRLTHARYPRRRDWLEVSF